MQGNLLYLIIVQTTKDSAWHIAGTSYGMTVSPQNPYVDILPLKVVVLGGQPLGVD